MFYLLIFRRVGWMDRENRSRGCAFKPKYNSILTLPLSNKNIIIWHINNFKNTKRNVVAFSLNSRGVSATIHFSWGFILILSLSEKGKYNLSFSRVIFVLGEFSSTTKTYGCFEYSGVFIFVLAFQQNYYTVVFQNVNRYIILYLGE